MRTIAVTAGYGPYAAWAARLAERFEHLNGLPCLNLSDEMDWNLLDAPTWCKTRIWDFVPSDAERVLWLDADIYPARAAPFDDVPDDVLFAARARAEGPDAGEVVRIQGLRDCVAYFNAGVFMMRRCPKTVLMMRTLRKFMAWEHVGGVPEQSWMNVLVQRRIGGFFPLDERWNWFARGEPPEDVVHVHVGGGRKRKAELLDALYAAGEVSR